MRDQILKGMLVAMLLMSAAVGQAQQPAGGQVPAGQPSAGTPQGGGPAAAQPVRKVLVAGENPAITLRDKEGGTTLTSANFWRVHWSPVGTGCVCFVTLNGQGAENVRIAIHDNPKVLDYVTKELMSSLNAKFNEPAFVPVQGTITPSGDNLTSHKETCKSDKYNVEITWSGLGEARWVDITPGANVLMTFAMVSATGAEVLVNGKKAAGGVFTGPGFPPAFLTFNETWRL